jgi:hypothetical protein
MGGEPPMLRTTAWTHKFMGRRERGAVRAKGTHRIEFTIYYRGQRFRPTLALTPTEANLRRAQQRIQHMYARIGAGTFDLLEEFPDYRMRGRYARSLPAPPPSETCNEVFDRFLTYTETRVAMNDLAFSTFNAYRQVLDRTWRPRLGTRPFLKVIYSELLAIAVSQGWRTKKTYTMASPRCVARLRSATRTISTPKTPRPRWRTSGSQRRIVVHRPVHGPRGRATYFLHPSGMGPGDR